MYTRILIPTDGSQLATKGLDHGLALAKALGVPVTVVSVTVPLGGLALQGVVQAQALESYDQGVREELAATERLVRQKVAEAGVAAEFISETAISAAIGIIETAQARNCGLIVISSHGRTGVVRMILGSQTQEVLAKSTVPVLVVK
ncbi:universal stress protein [Rhizobium sp. S152]|uniref:universal stress protein n=1 Tax=Rhizobium sp. S152 TaxID=3055038 RepID=UPI0025A97C15|nr:universal stress protein [Rhizobium sp. S152]MDM9628998.1 universal stress protein [Rhizobium sp. S152]